MTGEYLSGRVTRRRLLLGASGVLLVGCTDAPARPAATLTPPAPPTATIFPPTATAPMTPSPSPTAPFPTATPLAPRTPTAPPATAAGLTTWTDPRGLIQLRHPSDWRASIIAPSAGGRRPNNILQLASAGSYGGTPIFWLDLFEPQRSTLDAAVQRVRDDWVGKPYRLSDEAIEDRTVGGEAAKSFTFAYAPVFNPTIHSRGLDIVCNHNGREFFIEAITDYDNGLVIAAREIEAIIASVRFLT